MADLQEVNRAKREIRGGLKQKEVVKIFQAS